MPEFTVSFTVQTWWLAAYLLIGVVAWLPCEYAAHRQVHRRDESLWQGLRRGQRTRGWLRWTWALVAVIVAWPLAVWEVAR